jgi:replicative DNA helicase
MARNSTETIPDKLQPHNIEAEEAVLGALLIDPDAILRVATFLQPADFFVERNSWVFEAIRDLHERREPADLVTLSDELERRDQLSEVGGPAYLTSLINATPTSIHVEFYGRIVERTSLLRRLIDAAGQIARLAYDESQDAGEVVDRAEEIIFGVSARKSDQGLRPIRQVMDKFYDRIEYLHQHRGEIIGIPTGLADLDKLLGGLQRSDMLVLAGRPGMGKTSMALSIALQAARRWQKRVAIFSLEMSDEQLVQRLVSAETGIDSQRLRLGDIRDDEWPTFIQATNLLANSLIFIDDTPAISALELRSKARRLHAEHGLDLLIVDYLQLMRGDFRSENRQQEISFISRSIKSLARELNIPIMALSQLSRQVESRHDKRPMLSDLRESGCLTGDTLVYLPDTGQSVPIRELVENVNFQIMAVNPESWRLEPAPVTHVFPTGVKPVYRLTTQLGRTVRATRNHKFLTIHGWKRLDELHENDRIAIPRILLSQSTSEEIAGLAESDVYWDKIASIEADGEDEVFDLTVPGLHNFVANNIIVHNSIEQDADVVLFIYRDDVYNPDTEFPNIAEIIVSKHRSGPTGIFSAYFKRQLAQFVDLEVRMQPLDFE